MHQSKGHELTSLWPSFFLNSSLCRLNPGERLPNKKLCVLCASVVKNHKDTKHTE